jgi:hemerythrin-like metal-binding protein
MASLMSDSELLATVEWDPEKYGIGVRSIDDQHKHLISIINSLIRALYRAARASRDLLTDSGLGSSVSKKVQGSPDSTSASATVCLAKVVPIIGNRQPDPNFQRGSNIAKIIDELVSYTAKYLITEDHMLDTFAYVDRQSQNNDHELFTNEVARVFKLVEDYKVQETDVRRLLHFLKCWISEHIPRDRKYAPMLIEKGVGS